MQVLWSRAAPTRTACRCRACFRRTTTAASKRRLKVGDLFTACYSTILGTAVFADAKVKEERRKEWDRVISEAKAGIPIDESDGVERVVPDQSDTQEVRSVVRLMLSNDLKDKRKKGPVWDGISVTSSPSIHFEPVDLTLDLHLKQSISKCERKPNQAISSEDDADWPDEEDLTDKFCEPGVDKFAPREPVIRLHVDKMELMVSRLVSNLLLRRRQLSALAEIASSDCDISIRLKEIAGQIRSLQGQTRLPAYIFNDNRETATERHRLNSAIETVFDHTAADHSNFDLILAKICYNLLVCTSPPNIQTYNILIRCFDRLKMYELSQVVVDSFLYYSKFKPCSETVQLLLDHYSGQKDVKGYKAMVDRMRAVDGDLRMRMRAVDQIHRWHVQEWVATRKTYLKDGLLREKTPRDSAIFDSLINGFLELDKVKSAVRYLRAALHEGMLISSATLLRLVDACTSGREYRAGLQVLRLLLGLWKGQSEQVIYDSKARLAVHRLLGLCGIKLESRRPLPRSMSREVVQSLHRHMVMQSLGDKLDRFAATLTNVEAVLVKSNSSNAHDSETAMEDGIDQAASILKAHVKAECWGVARRILNNREDALVRDTEVVDCQPWLLTQYQRLIPAWRKKYDRVIDRNPHLSWSEKCEIMSHFRQLRRIPSDHPLYPAILKTFKLRKPLNAKSSTGQKIENDPPASSRVSISEEKSLDPETSKVQLSSPPRQPLEGSPPRMPEGPPIPSMPTTPSTLYLPLTQPREIARLEARAG